MTPQERTAHRRSTAHRLAVLTLTSDLRHASLDIYWESGEVPRLSDGKLTPWTTLSARHPYLAQRVDELLGPGGEKTVSAETKPQLKAKLPEAGRGETRDALASKKHQGQVQPVPPNLAGPAKGEKHWC